VIRLSTKGRYATRIVVYLALCDPQQPAPKQKIAEAEGISPDYVEQILTSLRAAGLVISHRGIKGGFSLARSPSSMTVADVIAATEGPICLVPCVEEACTRMTDCVTRAVWEKATAAITRIFQYTRIADLAAEAKALRDSQSLTYQI